MLYELAHYIQSHISFVWDVVEFGNSEVFGMKHHQKMKDIPKLLDKYTEKFQVIEAQKEDVNSLERFFSEQPKEAFRFFNPHGFDEKTLLKLINRKSFLMFLVKDGEEIVGYFFLRCFANGKAFKGRLVDARRRNQGIGKLMGNIINDVISHLGLKLFTTISPENYACLASAKAVNDIKIIRTLENGYYYIECMPKKIS